MIATNKDMPKLPLSEFSFSYQAQKTIDPSILSGSLWHGIFGNALRKLVCLVPNSECKSCMFLQQCDYPFLFEGVKSLDANLMEKYHSIPVPHVFKSDIDRANQLVAVQQQINVSVILIGKATQRLSIIIKAMALAGINGIGKARIPLQLKQVRQKNHLLQKLIFAEETEYEAIPAQSPLIPELPESIQLKFNTPYRQGKEKTHLNTEYFLMQIVRRISFLQHLYTTQSLDADFKQLKVLAHHAEIDSEVFFQQDKRYSSRHKQTLNTSGFMGTMAINMAGIEALWPYIYLGQWLNVGKNASFGYGSYELLNKGRPKS